MVKGFPILNEQGSSCESCILGKHQTHFFLEASFREKEHLGYIHTNLCGPIETQYIGGSFCLLTFIDDCGRKMWVYYLMKKSDMFTKIKEFKVLENKSVKNMSKCLDQMENESMSHGSLHVFLNNMELK